MTEPNDRNWLRFPTPLESWRYPLGKPAPTVIVASDDAVLLDEIIRHLEELPAWRLAGWARTAGELQRLLAESPPDAAIVSAGLARDLDPAHLPERPAGPRPTRLVVVATEQDAAILRCSLRLGAAFVLWPQERADLRAAVEAGMRGSAPTRRRSRLVAVWAPKGGSGASVLAAHLAGVAAALAPCLLVDLDLRHGDQRILLGAGNHPHSILDLLAAGDDIPPQGVMGVSWSHPAGFRVVLGSSTTFRPAGARPLPETWAEAAPALDAVCNVGTVGQGRIVVVADLPSGLGRLSLEVAERADATAVVVTPDLLALRRTRDASRLLGEGPAVGVLLNRWSRAAGVLTPGDVEAVLTLPVWATVSTQAGLHRIPDLGRLSRPACRALAPLAAQLVTGGTPGSPGTDGAKPPRRSATVEAGRGEQDRARGRRPAAGTVSAGGRR